MRFPKQIITTENLNEALDVIKQFLEDREAYYDERSDVCKKAKRHKNFKKRQMNYKLL